jgi:hypothetical protein
MVAALAFRPVHDTGPFTIWVETPPGHVARPGGRISIKVEVTNCSNEAWRGNVRLSVVGGVAAARIRDGNYAGQPLTLRPGRSQTVTFRGERPPFNALYTVTATVYDSVDRATGIGWLGM